MARSIPARFTDQLLDDDAVPPFAVQLAVSPVDADLAKAGLPMERQAGDVLREDARDQLPEAPLLGCDKQSLECHQTRTGTTCLAGDVDRVLPDARVTWSAAIAPKPAQANV